MSNFDDIFDTPAQREPEPHSDVPFDKEAWKEKKQAERSDAYDRIDRTAENIGRDGAAFQTYLDVQSRFDRYSVGNALLIMEKNPHAKRLGDVDYWKGQGGFIKRNQFDKPIIILEPGNEYTREDGSIGVSYNTKRVYDISQTTVREKAQPHYTERQLLGALISKYPMKIMGVDELPDNRGAMTDHDGSILVRKGMEFSDTFRAVAYEMACAELATDPELTPEQEFCAYSVTYLLCRKYGVDTREFHFDNAGSMFEGMDAQEIRGELSQIRDAANNISSRMAKALEQAKPARQQEHER